MKQPITLAITVIFLLNSTPRLGSTSLTTGRSGLPLVAGQEDALRPRSIGRRSGLLPLDGSVSLHQYHSLTLRTTVDYTQIPYHMALSPDGRLFMIAENDKIAVREVATGKLRKEIDALFGKFTRDYSGREYSWYWPFSFVFTPDRRSIIHIDASLPTENKDYWVFYVVTRDLETAKVRNCMQLDWDTDWLHIEDLISPDGSYIAMAVRGDPPEEYEIMRAEKEGFPPRKIPLFDVKTGEALALEENEIPTLKEEQGGCYGYGKTALAFSSDSRLLAACGGGNIKVWDLNTKKLITTISTEPQSPYSNCVAFSPDGRYVAGPSKPAIIGVWEADTGKQVKTLKKLRGDVSAIAFGPDGSVLFGSDQTGMIKVWDLKTGRLLKIFAKSYGPVRHLSVLADGFTALVAYENSIALLEPSAVKGAAAKGVTDSADFVQKLFELFWQWQSTDADNQQGIENEIRTAVLSLADMPARKGKALLAKTLKEFAFSYDLGDLLTILKGTGREGLETAQIQFLDFAINAIMLHGLPASARRRVLSLSRQEKLPDISIEKDDRVIMITISIMSNLSIVCVAGNESFLCELKKGDEVLVGYEHNFKKPAISIADLFGPPPVHDAEEKQTINLLEMLWYLLSEGSVSGDQIKRYPQITGWLNRIIKICEAVLTDRVQVSEVPAGALPSRRQIVVTIDSQP